MQVGEEICVQTKMKKVKYRDFICPAVSEYKQLRHVLHESVTRSVNFLGGIT